MRTEARLIFDGLGNITLTNGINPNEAQRYFPGEPQRYFRLRTP